MSKGMSKTLALIVTASVLLITAGIVTFMTQGGLDDVFTGSQKQSCASQVKAKCQYGTTDTISTPESCQQMEGSVSVQLSEDTEEIDGSGPTISCN